MTPRDRLAVLAAQLVSDPAMLAELRGDGDALASRPGLRDGAVALRWQIAVVRAVMEAPPDGDTVRELYGALIDRYRDRPARLAELRSLGEEIRQREEEGALARSLVVRSERRGGRSDGRRDGRRDERMARGTTGPAARPTKRTRGTTRRPPRR